jgi:ABC-type multidrug transport system fused ATPase/permease subunit
MKDQITQMPGQLDEPVAEFGENISVGSRQLLCLARAILQKNKILVMDEATANVDFETDACIQKTIRKLFHDVTVITIAHRSASLSLPLSLCPLLPLPAPSSDYHRINTILDYDRVLVLERGKIIEFDNPQKLLANPDSAFFGLAKEGRAL